VLLSCSSSRPAFSKYQTSFNFSKVTSYALYNRNSDFTDFQNLSDATRNSIELAIEQGIDAFISGEASEQTIHLAREAGMSFFAAGHHATERYGVKALGEWLAEEKGLDVTFIDIDNPV